MGLQQFPTFSLNEDEMHSVGVRWKKYVLRFDNFLLAMDVEKEERKRALLLYYGDFELQDIYDSLDNTGATYDTLKTALNTYFEPKTNECYEVWNFQKTTQGENETVQAFYLRLREIATRCNFTNVNKNIKNQLILGTICHKLRKYCFSNKEATLQDILTRGKLYEDVEFQSKEIESKNFKVESTDTTTEEVQALRKQITDLKIKMNRNTGKPNL